MAVPKRKHSYGRKRRKVNPKRVSAQATVKCRHCGAQKLGHRACPECGEK
ncbi:MAG TPA: 50S ribosomal protein L32 [candidate division WWE3 bacterium]|uniref:Large ribosomal subunit protein bL32 n=1 Tax=candidate division WWE3 bacterium TaxID=2053526 RepID=A0A7C1SND2_UNCKA|nr:50S ribosomal protein L32 [candidate division WWE3 bacterium]